MKKDIPSRNAWKRLKKNKAAMFSLVVIAACVVLAIFAYYIAPDASPYANRMIVEIGGQKPGYTQRFLKIPSGQNIDNVSVPQRLLNGQPDLYQYIPVSNVKIKGDSLLVEQYIDEETTTTTAYPRTQNGISIDTALVTKKFFLGTDKYGRDILSRLIVGVRVSLSVGLITVIISLTIGVLLGAVAGYYRGKIDEAIMWLINVIWSIPTLLLVFSITLMLGKGFWQIFIAIGLTMWVNVARLVRGQILGVRELEYVEAAKALGYSHSRTIIRHILPNIMGSGMMTRIDRGEKSTVKGMH
ncbi:MAG: ABC transporter permease [Chitinophagaceae bacterium]|nr:ABC transporter permease [Chitinophagaceae bacterium]